MSPFLLRVAGHVLIWWGAFLVLALVAGLPPALFCLSSWLAGGSDVAGAGGAVLGAGVSLGILGAVVQELVEFRRRARKTQH